MQFIDDFGPAFGGLQTPYVSPALSQPDSASTTMFTGSVAAVQFHAVTPTHFSTVAPLHGPLFKPLTHIGYEAPLLHHGPLHQAVGEHLNVVG